MEKLESVFHKHVQEVKLLLILLSKSGTFSTFLVRFSSQSFQLIKFKEM